MGTPLIVGDLAQVRMWTLQAEQAAVNTWYYNVVALSGTPTTDQDIANYVDLQLAAQMKSMISTDASYRGIQVTLLQRPTNPPATVFANTRVGAGTVSPPDCPRQCCGLISWVTALSGRRYRGRFYVPFPTNGFLATDGVPTAAYQTLMSGLATDIRTITSVPNAAATGTASTVMVIHHRPGISPTPSITAVTGQSVAAKFATQRRRGSYGRPNSSPI